MTTIPKTKAATIYDSCSDIEPTTRPQSPHPPRRSLSSDETGQEHTLCRCRLLHSSFQRARDSSTYPPHPPTHPHLPWARTGSDTLNSMTVFGNRQNLRLYGGAVLHSSKEEQTLLLSHSAQHITRHHVVAGPSPPPADALHPEVTFDPRRGAGGTGKIPRRSSTLCTSILQSLHAPR